MFDAWLSPFMKLFYKEKVSYGDFCIAGGNLTRSPEQDRIDFLAEVRNAALEPLWLDVQEPAPTNSSAWFSNRKTTKLWPADKVVFFNDVYFCARDVVRLLLHGADMACGMDFDRRKLDQVPVPVSSSTMMFNYWTRTDHSYPAFSLTCIFSLQIQNESIIWHGIVRRMRKWWGSSYDSYVHHQLHTTWLCPGLRCAVTVWLGEEIWDASNTRGRMWKFDNNDLGLASKPLYAFLRIIACQVQQSNLKLYLKQKMKLPEWVSGVLGLIPAVLLSQAASNSANEVRGHHNCVVDFLLDQSATCGFISSICCACKLTMQKAWTTATTAASSIVDERWYWKLKCRLS